MRFIWWPVATSGIGEMCVCHWQNEIESRIIESEYECV